VTFGRIACDRIGPVAGQARSNALDGGLHHTYAIVKRLPQHRPDRVKAIDGGTPVVNSAVEMLSCGLHPC
jgi:hypothetical protein